MPELFGSVNAATARTLALLGHDVQVVRAIGCCGALHAHNGDLGGARDLARRAVAALEPGLAADRGALVVTNSAGCGAHVKEWAELFPRADPWHARAEAVSRRTRDFTELAAAALGARSARPRLREGAFELPLAWDDPCHLCHGQGVRAEPRAILDAISGAARVELEGAESCCGSAGIYSLLRPADSRAVLASKLAALRASGARTLVTANPGCQMQWEAGIRRAGIAARVAHLAEILDACEW
jgi:glycolate oxidase iron-sulfur subunit